MQGLNLVTVRVSLLASDRLSLDSGGGTVRNLIVCCDGTWNTRDQKRHDVPVPTNVVRIYNAVAEADANGNAQLRYYHPGVGAGGSLLERLAGGAFGAGLSRNIMSAYKWLCSSYIPGDRIFMFGFSRGAFTVRSLAGMVGMLGLLDLSDLSEEDAWGRVKKAYEKGYRKKQDRSKWAKDWVFHRDAQGNDAVIVDFLGVWDTVGALGIPDSLALLNIFDPSKKYSFHDLKLGSHVLTARHAVAIDEMRASFTPTLWENVSEHADAREVWFPGVHSNVGGGYVDTGLSDIALEWMMNEAEGAGLGLKQGMAEQLSPDSKGILYDSCKGIYKHMPTCPRSIPAIISKNSGESVHPSALERQAAPPISQAPYRRTILLSPEESMEVDVFAVEPWNDTGLYMEAGRTYRLEASGQWMDLNIKCGPCGANDGKFNVEKLAYIAGTSLGKLQGIFRRISGNKSADFMFTRREDDISWFALVGAVANAGNPGKDGTPARHEIFPVCPGSGKVPVTRITPGESGYLYAFANDAWNFYGNNRGSVQMKITCTG